MGTTATVAAGLEYAVRAGARVVTASFTHAGADPVLASVVEDHPGPLFVFAAGNSGSDNDRAPVWPCGIDDGNVLCVAATDQHDALASFSNVGAVAVDLAAPGEAILSNWPGDEYRYLGGTSMAAAHVAGVAALVLAHRPYLPTQDVRDAVRYGGDSVAALRGKTWTGRRLNAHGALLRREPGLSVRCAKKPRGGRLRCSLGPVRFINRVANVKVRVKRGARIIATRTAYPNRSGRFFLRLHRSVKGRVRISFRIALRQEWLESGLHPTGPQLRTRRWG